MTLELRVLGPLEAWREGRPLKVGGPKQRGVLAMLALDGGRVLSTERLLHGVWGDEPPPGAHASLQVHISNLRKLLGGSGAAIVTRAPGYLLDLERARVDALELERRIADVRRQRRAGNATSAYSTLRDALSLWRGEPLDDLRAAPFARNAQVRLEELRLAAQEDLFDLALEVGDHRSVIVDLETTLGEHPLREGLWRQLMIALYRSGRQADALAAFRRARKHLMEELGVEPGPDLQRLELDVLHQSPDLGSSHRDRMPPPEGNGIASHPGLGATVPEAAVSAWLELEDGATIAIDDIVVLGRHPTSDVHLRSSAVSRHHAEVRPAMGGRILRDLGSVNGTRVNGELIVQRLLEDGDVITIGRHRCTFRTA